MSFMPVRRFTISEPLARAVYLEGCKRMAHKSNQVFFSRSVVSLRRDVRLLRFVDPTYVSNYAALGKSHPRGSKLTSNRYSGDFLGLTESCGTYFGVDPVQSNRIKASLAPVVQPFGVDFELSHYTTAPDASGVSALDRGKATHGARHMADGRLNPVLGAGGSFFVRYRLKQELRLLSLDFTDPDFLSALDLLGKAPAIAAELPTGYALSKAFVSDEAVSSRLLHQALAAAMHDSRRELDIHGIIAGSVREVSGVKTGNHSVICVWSDDGACLNALEAERVSYFDYARSLPSLLSHKVDDRTDFARLRQLAEDANK